MWGPMLGSKRSTLATTSAIAATAVVFAFLLRHRRRLMDSALVRCLVDNAVVDELDDLWTRVRGRESEKNALQARTAALRAQWKSSRRRQQQHTSVKLTLPPPVTARGLLSSAEIEEVLDYGRQIVGTLGKDEARMRYDSTHEVVYLHHGGEMQDGVWRTFQRACAPLFERLLSEMRRRAHDGGLCDASEVLHVRCIELHSYTKGGGLTAAGHFDDGSAITLSVALVPSAKGGVFTTTAASGAVTAHALGAGDAIVLHSHTVHNVTRVERGARQSLVMELWKQRENRRDRFA